MMGFIGQEDNDNIPAPQVTQATGASAKQPSKRQRLSTPSSSERKHPTIIPTPRPTPPLIEQVTMKNDEVLGANQRDNNQTPALKIRGSSTATSVADDFGDESPFYTARPYVLNEHHHETGLCHRRQKGGNGIGEHLANPKSVRNHARPILH